MKVNYDTHNNTHQFLRNSLKLEKKSNQKEYKILRVFLNKNLWLKINSYFLVCDCKCDQTVYIILKKKLDSLFNVLFNGTIDSYTISKFNTSGKIYNTKDTGDELII